MSNIRDLQKLKGGRHMQPLMQIPHRMINPQLPSNYDPITLQIGHNRMFKNTQYGKDFLRPAPSNIIHKRGSSFGTPEINDSHTFDVIQHSRLSIYNFPLKLDLPTTCDHFHQSPHPLSKTDRKAKNNYVFCKQKSEKITIHKDRSHQELSIKCFNQLLAVGKGGFGKVWKVEQRRGKRIFAMKLMNKAKIISKKSVTSVLNERKFLQRVSHPFLVNMIYAFQDRQNLYLIMDYLDGGDLRYHLGNRQFFSQKQAKFFIANIILSLQYLHRHHIIHRDLKPENLVFDSDGFLRLTDLGISRALREDNHQDTSGTPGYMAPEVMLRKSHSYTADYFALGVMAYQLMLGKRPYHGANRKEIKEQILARQATVRVDQLPFRWSPYSIDFINKLLIRNPDQRLGSNGIEEIKHHPWLSDIDWQKVISKKIKPPFRPIRIEDDYQNYKEQISEDTLNQNEDQISILLRQPETQALFEDYYFEKQALQLTSKKTTSYPTNSTEENLGRK